MDRQVTPPKQFTSPTWGPTPPCKQALNPNINVLLQCLYITAVTKDFLRSANYNI